MSWQYNATFIQPWQTRTLCKHGLPFPHLCPLFSTPPRPSPVAALPSSQVCDVITINCPLHSETQYLFNADLISQMKRGSYLINTARGKICDPRAVAQALESGQLAGYAGDVWFPQPAPQDHPWRTMPHHGMTPHISGTTLSAQVRLVRVYWAAFFPVFSFGEAVNNGQVKGLASEKWHN